MGISAGCRSKDEQNFWLVLESFFFSAPVEKNVQVGPNLDQDYKTLYLMILSKNFQSFYYDGAL